MGAAKIDYIHPLKKGKVEFGAKSAVWLAPTTDMRFENQIDKQWVLDPSKSNRFKYTENINAAYANYSTNCNKEPKFQLGLGQSRPTQKVIPLHSTMSLHATTSSFPVCLYHEHWIPTTY
ncbi:MAG: outer membrane beta-barrel protein [Spirosomataceae bacterium]